MPCRALPGAQVPPQLVPLQLAAGIASAAPAAVPVCQGAEGARPSPKSGQPAGHSSVLTPGPPPAEAESVEAGGRADRAFVPLAAVEDTCWAAPLAACNDGACSHGL